MFVSIAKLEVEIADMVPGGGGGGGWGVLKRSSEKLRNLAGFLILIGRQSCRSK